MTALAWWLAVALVVQVPPPGAAVQESSALESERQSIARREGDELEALAARLEAAGRKDDAAVVRRQIEPPPPECGPSRFVPLTEVARRGNSALPAEAASIQRQSTRPLYELALRGLSGPLKHYRLADVCLRAVLARDPDHVEARRLMGYVTHENGWATPFAVEQLQKGRTLHPTYGWVETSWVDHLDQGELPEQGFTNPKQARWVPAAVANAQRSSIARGWRIATEHFEIVTDVPLSEAISFGRKLESFHDLFFSLLADVIGDELPLARRFRGESVPRPRLHSVYYCATQDEFIDQLRVRGVTDAGEILGIYLEPKKGERRGPAYFFRDQGGRMPVTATLFHEVSHQLLFESTSVRPGAYRENNGNYWVFEGLGTYFETVIVEPDGALQFGGFVGPRIEMARRHVLDPLKYTRIQKFVQLPLTGFNTADRDRRRLNYEQAMALAVFLMDGNGGKYREEFLDYVRDAHRGRLKGDGGRELDTHVGTTYKALEAEFLVALQTGP
jgi:hypothetical protein